jgi:hypothetical protein
VAKFEVEVVSEELDSREARQYLNECLIYGQSDIMARCKMGEGPAEVRINKEMSLASSVGSAGLDYKDEIRRKNDQQCYEAEESAKLQEQLDNAATQEQMAQGPAEVRINKEMSLASGVRSSDPLFLIRGEISRALEEQQVREEQKWWAKEAQAELENAFEK